MEAFNLQQSKTNFGEDLANVITSTIGPLINANGEYTKDEVEMSNALNTFFASVVTIKDLSNVPNASPVQRDNSDALNSISITERDVLKCLEKLKVNKSPGPDTISPRILKEAKHEFSIPLTLLVNKSLQSGTMPDEWKFANVTPIFKQGSKSFT